MDAPRYWRCIVCGYIAEGECPPEICPVCGATSEYFEPYEPQVVRKLKRDTRELRGDGPSAYLARYRR